MKKNTKAPETGVKVTELPGAQEAPQETNANVLTETAETDETGTAPKQAQNQGEELLKKLEIFKPEPYKTPEERISRIKHFEALSKRYNALKEKEDELSTFLAGNDKLNAIVTFKNAQGFEFKIQNSNVIQKITQEAQKELSILLQETSTEILTFDI